MATSLSKGFADSLEKMCLAAGEKCDTVVKLAALDLYGQVIQRSPVGNPDIWKAGKGSKGYVGGRFKNNWQVGVGYVNTDTSRGPSASGSDSLAAFTPTLNSWKPGDTIYLTNSLPYAQRLEYGWSKQAPGGMVRLSVQNAAQAFAKAAAQVRST